MLADPWFRSLFSEWRNLTSIVPLMRPIYGQPDATGKLQLSHKNQAEPFGDDDLPELMSKALGVQTGCVPL